MNIAVLGAGAWGTALALHLHACGHTVTLTSRRLEQAAELSTRRENERLPGFPLPDDLQIGHENAPILLEAELAVLAAPTVGLRGLAREVAAARSSAWRLVAAVAVCKGLEPGTGRLPAEILAEELPDLPTGVLGGPNHAGGIAAGLPAAATLAFPGGTELAPRLQEELSGGAFRLYLSEDPLGVSLGGSLKNVYALAAGCADGLGLGDNAKAALLTRALAEMTRIGEALGGRAATFAGLSGVGDLMATCYGSWSRNRRFGENLARPGSGEGPGGFVEGARATLEYRDRCRSAGVDAPLVEEVAALVEGSERPEEALHRLLARPLRREG